MTQGGDPVRAAGVMSAGEVHGAKPLEYARKVLEALDTLKRPVVPEALRTSNDNAIEAWQAGQGSIPDELTGEFSAWLARNLARVSAIEETKRRLRALLSTLCTFDADATRGEHELVQRWLREQWNISTQPGCGCDERERFVAKYVRERVLGRRPR